MMPLPMEGGRQGLGAGFVGEGGRGREKKQ